MSNQRYPLQAEFYSDRFGNTFIMVFGESEDGSFDVELGSIQVGSKPNEEAVKWAKQQIKKKVS